MKITIGHDELVAHLQQAARIASSRSAIQALAGVQLVATDGRVELRSTDMDLGLRTPVAAQVVRPGGVVLPARLLLDVVRRLPGSDVSLELRPEQQDVEVVAGSARFHLRILRSEDFPELPEPGGDRTVTLPAAAFTETIARVSRAASRDETRPILTGVLVSAEGSSLRMVATDSYRLSVKETALEQPLTEGFEANVPARALEEVARLCGEQEATIAIGVRANQVVFQVGEVALSSRLIDGQFPNYRQLLPEQFEHELTLDTAEVLDVVERISLMAQKNAPLRLSFGEGELRISAQTPDVGEASETLPAPFAGEPFEIGFNPEFLTAGLQSAGAERISLKLISPLRPGLIEAADGSGFLYLIMPIRLNV
ncbi:MAG: DNA polymerase III subunit beta [Solirubrobacteraceae bacterium]|nr:DNA polymerase III subunit beta [Solirubrobacteraceae bacterium]